MSAEGLLRQEGGGGGGKMGAWGNGHWGHHLVCGNVDRLRGTGEEQWSRKGGGGECEMFRWVLWGDC